MPFTHHSHSGQFCGHAVDTLEDIVKDAITKGMTTLCLTEHMPREEIDFYPEEGDSHTGASLVKLYDDFYDEARRLEKAYASQIQIFVGFEGEWIRKSSLKLIQNVFAKHTVDLFIGSVHHVHTIPIDYDHDMYYKARDVAGGSDEQIFLDYFDSQYAMLQALNPPIVGHFDLIRLKSDDPNRSFTLWPAVWDKILRNLRFIADYGGVLELNSSALRKGMTEPYPNIEICKEFKAMGGRFTLSDDSHGTAQVGLNYHKVLENMKKAGMTEICCLAPASQTNTTTLVPGKSFSHMSWLSYSVIDLEKHAFWSKTS